MNRIDRLFSEKSGEILSIYITAGYPGLTDTPILLKALQDHGADMVEIGIPFSDPLADGPVIQRSSQVALGNGMNLELLFKQLAGIRERVHIPLVMMGYLNPVLQMGIDHFLEKCKQTGIDGVIIPDLPPDEYDSKYRELFESFGIHFTMLITPQTEVGRINRIAGLSKGFLYLVADASTTGSKSKVGSHQLAYFKRIQEMDLQVPGLVGFGISNHETFMAASTYTSGAIIGSAFIKALGEEEPQSLEEKVKKFIRQIRNGQ
jgi:tryptophan synthase alpha chain